MVAHAIVGAALFCVAINPAIDKVAGAFPTLLPLAIAVTITDTACAIVMRAPSPRNIAAIIGDALQVVADAPRGRPAAPRFFAHR